MMREQALKSLDRLDRYWSRARDVSQTVPAMAPWQSRGCFGAHLDRALRGRFCVANSHDGYRAFGEIAFALGISAERALEVLRRHSGGADPFGTIRWLRQPHLAWPEISAELREIAGEARP